MDVILFYQSKKLHSYNGVLRPTARNQGQRKQNTSMKGEVKASADGLAVDEEGNVGQAAIARHKYECNGEQKEAVWHIAATGPFLHRGGWLW
jgi:hypothetical protein